MGRGTQEKNKKHPPPYIHCTPKDTIRNTCDTDEGRGQQKIDRAEGKKKSKYATKPARVPVPRLRIRLRALI